jgi:hypothetical protein
MVGKVGAGKLVYLDPEATLYVIVKHGRRHKHRGATPRTCYDIKRAIPERLGELSGMSVD